MNINEYGFFRVAACSPKVRVADCDYNTNEIKSMIEEAEKENVQVVCFPELSITSYTCGDLFFQSALLRTALDSLLSLVDFMKDKSSIIAIVGLPLVINNSLYNVAAIISHEGILGFVPKIHIPNNNEYREKRWFASGSDLSASDVNVNGCLVPVSSDGMVFKTSFATIAIEICEDLWMPNPPSSELALRGADIIFNLSASNELIAKNDYRKLLIVQQSGRCTSGYVYSSAGCGESSTDMVFSGATAIAENGTLISEGKRFLFESEMIISDIDIMSLRNERLNNSNFIAKQNVQIKEVDCNLKAIHFKKIYRQFNPHPFIPSPENLQSHLSEAFNIQAVGLAKRLKHTGIKKAVIGVSGGLDSTLALLVAVKCFDLLGLDRSGIIGITMPGFGTTNRTLKNSIGLMSSLGISSKNISILPAVVQHFKDIEHDIYVHDITYENSQARERTQILMDYANKVDGLVIGTGNLSELALGWATYNGDHMSMYAVNASIPKTLVKTLVEWIANTQMSAEAQEILLNIVDTPFSPELLPSNEEGEIAQKTEHFVGPYELHDFFIHRMLRYGDSPKRIIFVARIAFAEKYTADEIKKWLKVFINRFFAQQFKRSCMPDGPKVGTVNLSPRNNWQMPSDAVSELWIKELEEY